MKKVSIIRNIVAIIKYHYHSGNHLENINVLLPIKVQIYKPLINYAIINSDILSVFLPHKIANRADFTQEFYDKNSLIKYANKEKCIESLMNTSRN